MANQWPENTYLDGDWSTAKPCGLPEFSAPIPGDTTEYVFTQPFMALRTVASATALNTAHPSAGLTPSYSDYVLVAESDEKQDVGNGIVRWMRTYAKVPTTHSEYESYSYNFIGTSPLGALSSAQAGRLRFTERVTSRVQHDYFLCATGQTYTTPGAVPVIRAFAYCVQHTIDATTYGGYYARQDYVHDATTPPVITANVGDIWPTTPTESEYVQMMKDAATNGWSAGISFQKLTTDAPALVDQTSKTVYPTAFTASGYTQYYGQVAAEDSELTRWLGNIYLRRTRYVLAR